MSGPTASGSPTPVVVVGDVMTDILVRVDVTLPAGLAIGSDTRARISTSGGGSGANTACWLASAGRDVTFVGRVGDDHFGAAAVAQLAACAVRTQVRVDPERPTGTCVVLVDVTGQRSMLPDSGANIAVTADDLPPLGPAVPGRRRAHLHLSGYTLLNPASRAAGISMLDTARRAGVTTSVGAASAALIRQVGATEVLGMLAGASLVVANLDEVQALLPDSPYGPEPGGSGWSTPLADPLPHAHLVEKIGTVVVTGGAHGAWWFARGHDPIHVPAPAVEPVDTTGAGDAFAAGFLGAWLDGVPPELALAAGHRLGAHAVARVGARPEPRARR
ncbi:MAG: carbohydrate kinase family protein [Actinomycetes bacterium]